MQLSQKLCRIINSFLIGFQSHYKNANSTWYCQSRQGPVSTEVRYLRGESSVVVVFLNR